MRGVAPQSLLRNFTQTSLLVRYLRLFFISLYWRPVVAMSHHKRVAKPCLPDKNLSMFIVPCIQALVQVLNKVDLKDTSELFLMALQKGYF